MFSYLSRLNLHKSAHVYTVHVFAPESSVRRWPLDLKRQKDLYFCNSMVKSCSSLGLQNLACRFCKGQSIHRRFLLGFLRAIWSHLCNLPAIANLLQQEQTACDVSIKTTCVLLRNSTRDGAVVKALASHQCGPGSFPGLGEICGLSVLLVLVLDPSDFSLVSPVFPSPQKTNISKFQLNLEGHPK